MAIARRGNNVFTVQKTKTKEGEKYFPLDCHQMDTLILQGR